MIFHKEEKKAVERLKNMAKELVVYFSVYGTAKIVAEEIAKQTGADIAEIEPVITQEETDYVKAHYRDVEVRADVQNYIMDLVEKTRKESAFVTGVSTRGALALYKACQVNAAFAGREYVIPEDIRDVAKPVLGHRIFSGSGARAKEAEMLLDRMIDEIPVPLEKK